MTKKIIAIWAEDERGLIGRDGGLPWRLPKELQHFKETTNGHALLMGRVTFDGMNRRLLPGRETLILSANLSEDDLSVKVLSSVEEVLDWFQQEDKTLFVVGGASVYKAFEPYYDDIIKTTVHGSFEGDTYFPDFDWSEFVEVSSQRFLKDESNSHDFTVTHWTRQKKE